MNYRVIAMSMYAEPTLEELECRTLFRSISPQMQIDVTRRAVVDTRPRPGVSVRYTAGAVRLQEGLSDRQVAPAVRSQTGAAAAAAAPG